MINLYFQSQAASALPGALQRVQSLQEDPAFDITNPNKVSALYGAFASNLEQFHAPTGEGYFFLASKVKEIDSFNPSAASRLVMAFKKYKKLDSERQSLMQQALHGLRQDAELSKNTRDHLEKILG